MLVEISLFALFLLSFRYRLNIDMAKDDEVDVDDELSIDEIDKWLSQLESSGDDINLLL